MSDDAAPNGVVIVYVNMPSGIARDPSLCPSVHLSVGRDGAVTERAVVPGNSRRRSLIAMTAVAAVVAVLVGVGSQAVLRSGKADAAGSHQVAAASPAANALASTPAGAAGSMRPPAAPAGVAETVVRDLSLPPRVTPAPGAAAGPSGPKAFGFNP
jgi:hypothetical protein